LILASLLELRNGPNPPFCHDLRIIVRQINPTALRRELSARRGMRYWMNGAVLEAQNPVKARGRRRWRRAASGFRFTRTISPARLVEKHHDGGLEPNVRGCLHHFFNYLATKKEWRNRCKRGMRRK
jgi:hypothetical protein